MSEPKDTRKVATNEPGELSEGDIENQAGTEAMDPKKLQRDSAEGEDVDGETPRR